MAFTSSGISRRFLSTAVGALALGWVALLSAQTSSDEAKEEPVPTLKPADADDDGKIARAEWTKLMQGFSRLDANHDGQIDLAELQTAGTTKDFPLILKSADTDGDEKIARAEWSALAKSFPKIDTSKDSAIDLSELQAAADAVVVVEPKSPASIGQGLWQGWIVDGRGENPNTGSMQIELLVSGNQIAGREVNGKGQPLSSLGAGTFVASGGEKAGYLDAMYTEGPHSGRVHLGVFRMQDDALWWCVSNRSGQRPLDFFTGNGAYLMILRRAEEPK